MTIEYNGRKFFGLRKVHENITPDEKNYHHLLPYYRRVGIIQSVRFPDADTAVVEESKLGKLQEITYRGVDINTKVNLHVTPPLSRFALGDLGGRYTWKPTLASVKSRT